MDATVAVTSGWSRAFFISWYWVAAVGMSNLLVAQVIDGFIDEKLDGGYAHDADGYKRPSTPRGHAASIGSRGHASVGSPRQTSSMSQPASQPASPPLGPSPLSGGVAAAPPADASRRPQQELYRPSAHLADSVAETIAQAGAQAGTRPLLARAVSGCTANECEATLTDDATEQAGPAVRPAEPATVEDAAVRAAEVHSPASRFSS